MRLVKERRSPCKAKPSKNLANQKSCHLTGLNGRKQTQKQLKQLENDVKAIINQVKENGDNALIDFAEKFDKAKLTTKTLRVKSGRNQRSLQQNQPRTNLCSKIHERKSLDLPKATAHPNRNQHLRRWHIRSDCSASNRKCRLLCSRRTSRLPKHTCHDCSSSQSCRCPKNCCLFTIRRKRQS